MGTHIPILTEETVTSFVGQAQACTAITEHTKRDFSPHIDSEDVRQRHTRPVRQATDEENYLRARLHSRIFPLQAVAYALHHELDTAQIRQAVEKADAWYETRAMASV